MSESEPIYSAPGASHNKDGIAPSGSANEATRLKDLTPEQWKTGAASWLGWTFDGLDMHLYTLVAVAFVAQLMSLDKTDDQVTRNSALIQASFLVGWALGGGLFGIIGDRIGRARTLMLTILTYALFTGLSFFATQWWHLLIFRFVAALGIGGEWAVGASLLSETWPKRWRPWMAAVLQTGVNCGVLVASFAVFFMSWFDLPQRAVFLVGVLPAFLVLWIRRALPEPEEWRAARHTAGAEAPSGFASIAALFRPPVVRITIPTLLVCAFSLSGHWAFMFWCFQHIRNLPELASWTEAQRSEAVTTAMTVVMICSIIGNFLAAFLVKLTHYRGAISFLCVSYFACMFGAYSSPRSYESMWVWIAAIGICQGLFALFTMYLPPLFPTLLRTTGAGFCYNIGRIAAAAATVIFVLNSKVGDYRIALLSAGFLFLPAAVFVWALPEPPDESFQLPTTVAD